MGSFDLVRKIRQRFPDQDIIYLADRASFPYGAKSRTELLACTESRIVDLARLGCRAIVLASNAPSVMVLDQLRERTEHPVLGVTPPVRQALARSRSKRVAVLGVSAMVESPELAAYIADHAGDFGAALVNASELVELVENGSFLSDRNTTLQRVQEFLDRLRGKFPGIDVCTLSSTHLPWLQAYFEEAAPGILFMDPADQVLDELVPHLRLGAGKTICLATESEQYPFEQFARILVELDVKEAPHRFSHLPYSVSEEMESRSGTSR